MRGAMCVIVRDLIVYGVLTDMMRGRPAVYATFSSYDEVAHHSGLDARRHARGAAQARPAVRPHRARARATRRARTRSSCSPTTARPRARRSSSATATALDELVERSLCARRGGGFAGGDEQNAMVGHAVDEATGRKEEKRAKNDVSDRDVVVLGSGNLGLVYLMEETRRLTLEEIDERHPELIPALREHPHVGWLLVRSAEHGAVVLGAGGRALPRRGARRGRGSARALLADRGAAPAAHGRLRARRRHHGRQLLRPGARRGLRVRGADLASTAGSAARRREPFILHPPHLPLPPRADHRRGGGARAALGLAPRRWRQGALRARWPQASPRAPAEGVRAGCAGRLSPGPKRTGRGSGPMRPLSPRPARRCARPGPGSSSKSNSAMFSPIRAGVTDFGKTMLPRWMCQRSTTCAGVGRAARRSSSMHRVVERLALRDRGPRLGRDAVLLGRRRAPPRCGSTGAARSG